MGKPDTIIRFLHNFWAPEVSKTDNILELGCNSGANLNHLRNIGYVNVSGIDINEQSIYIIQNIFPETFEKSDLYIGSFEDILPTLPDKSFDVSFSIYSLSHIHPDVADDVFEHIVRVTKKYIVTIDEEKESKNNRVFPRNYKNIFENFGCKQIKYKEKTEVPMEIVVTRLSNTQNEIPYVVYKHSFDYYDLPIRIFETNKE